MDKRRDCAEPEEGVPGQSVPMNLARARIQGPHTLWLPYPKSHALVRSDGVAFVFVAESRHSDDNDPEQPLRMTYTHPLVRHRWFGLGHGRDQDLINSCLPERSRIAGRAFNSS